MTDDAKKLLNSFNLLLTQLDARPVYGTSKAGSLEMYRIYTSK